MVKEINIFGVIGEDYELTDKGFSEQLKDAGDIIVNINSPGGSVFHGLAIYNMLAKHGKDNNVEIMVIGAAHSMAATIVQAGKTRKMATNASMMIHNPLNAAFGNAEEFRRLADELDDVGQTLAEIFVARTGKKLDDIKSLMEEEKTFKAVDAKKNGFIDEVVDIAQSIVVRPPALTSFKNIDKRMDFYKRAYAMGDESKFDLKIGNQTYLYNRSQIMNLDAIQKELNVESPVEALAKIKELKAVKPAPIEGDIKAQIDAAVTSAVAKVNETHEKELGLIKSQLDEHNKRELEKRTKDFNAKVNKLIEDRYFLTSQRDDIVSVYTNEDGTINFDAFEKFDNMSRLIPAPHAHLEEENGVDGDDKGGDLMSRIEALATEKKISFTEAKNILMNQDPKAFEDYHQKTTSEIKE